MNADHVILVQWRNERPNFYGLPSSLALCQERLDDLLGSIPPCNGRKYSICQLTHVETRTC